MTPRKPLWTRQYWAHCENETCSFYLRRFKYDLDRFEASDFCFNCGHKIWKQCRKCGTKLINPKGNEARFCENCGTPHKELKR
jgi:hypothetical protein